MTREQAINYLFSCGFTNEQVCEVVRALTYEPTPKNNLGVDCISRADAIQAMQDKAKKLTNEDTINGLCGAVAILFDLPSVTPQLSVPEVTTLAELTTKLTKECEEAYNKGYADGMKAQEPKTGVWIEHFDESGKWYECDQCHSDWGGAVNFCPDCGADMREVKE